MALNAINIFVEGATRPNGTTFVDVDTRNFNMYRLTCTDDADPYNSEAIMDLFETTYAGLSRNTTYIDDTGMPRAWVVFCPANAASNTAKSNICTGDPLVITNTPALHYTPHANDSVGTAIDYFNSVGGFGSFAAGVYFPTAEAWFNPRFITDNDAIIPAASNNKNGITITVNDATVANRVVYIFMAILKESNLRMFTKA
jgi:hypothetical protein